MLGIHLFSLNKRLSHPVQLQNVAGRVEKHAPEVQGGDRRETEHCQTAPVVKEDHRAGDDLPECILSRTPTTGAGAAGGRTEGTQRQDMGPGGGHTGRGQEGGRRRGEGGRQKERRMMTYK